MTTPERLPDDLAERLRETCCQPREVRWWGSDYVVTPELLPYRWGDGRHLVAIQPLNTRPQRYIVCVDSAMDLSSDEWYDLLEGDGGVEEYLEEYFGRCECEGCLDGEELEEGETPNDKWPAPCLEVGTSWWSIDVLCDVAPELAERFTVRLFSDREFRGCGIHGSGGTLRGPDALQRARLIAFGPQPQSTLRIYLVCRAAGDHTIDVPCADIMYIDLYQEDTDD